MEAKSGATVTNEMLRGLRWWMDLAGNEAEGGVVVYGRTKRTRRKNVSVLPWHAI